MEFLKKLSHSADFRVATNFAVAVTAIVLLLPFSVNNLIQMRFLLGSISTFVVIVLVLNVWLITRNRFNPMLVFLGLVPAVVVFLFISLQDQGVIGALWCYPAIIVFYIILPERNAWLANLLVLSVAIPQSFQVFDTPTVMRFIATLFAVSVFAILFVRIISIQQSLLQRQAVTDPLTGLKNRVLLELSLEQSAYRCQRYGSLATLVMLDLDHFKSINDNYGHAAGDEALRKVGALLRNRLRRNESAFRVGGEEFLVLLDDTDANGGSKFAEELRQALSANRIPPGITVTASFGVSTYQQGEPWRSWLKRCDEFLYQAKAQGRNTVVAGP